MNTECVRLVAPCNPRVTHSWSDESQRRCAPCGGIQAIGKKSRGTGPRHGRWGHCTVRGRRSAAVGHCAPAGCRPGGDRHVNRGTACTGRRTTPVRTRRPADRRAGIIARHARGTAVRIKRRCTQGGSGRPARRAAERRRTDRRSTRRTGPRRIYARAGRIGRCLRKTDRRLRGSHVRQQPCQGPRQNRPYRNNILVHELKRPSLQ
jgi:hypothetical protein